MDPWYNLSSPEQREKDKTTGGKLFIKAYEREIHRERNEIWFANEMPFYAYLFGTNVKV